MKEFGQKAAQPVKTGRKVVLQKTNQKKKTLAVQIQEVIQGDKK